MDFLQASSPLCHSYDHQFPPEKPHSDSKTDHFIIDDLLDFPTDDLVLEEGAAVFMTTDDVVADTPTDSSTSVGSCNSSGDAHPNLAGDVGCRSFVDPQFSNLCFPHDDLAEFEWLSNFVDESLSDEDVQKLHLISGVKVRSEHTPEFQPTTTISQTTNSIFNNDITIPGKARTKRSRVASCNWASRLLVTPPGVTGPVANMASNTKSDISNSTQQNNMNTPLKKEIHDDMYSKNEEGRNCFHCATTKTPQWRTGPMGPRTLCNACGVRYKSGRLVPEYRPAASPTFVLTKHSNSHRKVLELRRQKMQKPQHFQQQIMNHQDIMSNMPNGDGYLINQHINPNFWQVI